MQAALPTSSSLGVVSKVERRATDCWQTIADTAQQGILFEEIQNTCSVNLSKPALWKSKGAFRTTSISVAVDVEPGERPVTFRSKGEGAAVDTTPSPLLAAVWEGNLSALPALLETEDPNVRDGLIDRPGLKDLSTSAVN